MKYEGVNTEGFERDARILNDWRDELTENEFQSRARELASDYGIGEVEIYDYLPEYVSEPMTESDRQSLENELYGLHEKIKTTDIIDPKWMRRTDEINSLLISDGKRTDLKITVGKMLKSKRVTSFTRDRR